MEHSLTRETVHLFIFSSCFNLVRAAVDPELVAETPQARETGQQSITMHHTDTFTPTVYAHLPDYGPWGETREPGGNPHDNGEHMHNSAQTNSSSKSNQGLGSCKAAILQVTENALRTMY